MGKAKNSKILFKKQANYIIATNLKFGIIFFKFGILTSNYITLLPFYAKLCYESFQNFGIMLLNTDIWFETSFILNLYIITGNRHLLWPGDIAKLFNFGNDTA